MIIQFINPTNSLRVGSCWSLQDKRETSLEYLVLDSVSGDTTGFVIQQGNLIVSSSLTSNTKYFKDLQGLWQSANAASS